MAMATIKERTVGDVTILDVAGKILIGEGAVHLREAVQKAVEANKRKLLFNLKDVTFIDSSGIGELVASYTAMTNRGGKLKLLNLPPKISDILMITQLITVFDVYDSEAEAVASF